jgi:hypothetical protein
MHPAIHTREHDQCSPTKLCQQPPRPTHRQADVGNQMVAFAIAKIISSQPKSSPGLVCRWHQRTGMSEDSDCLGRQHPTLDMDNHLVGPSVCVPTAQWDGNHELVTQSSIDPLGMGPVYLLKETDTHSALSESSRNPTERGDMDVIGKPCHQYHGQLLNYPPMNICDACNAL